MNSFEKKIDIYISQLYKISDDFETEENLKKSKLIISELITLLDKLGYNFQINLLRDFEKINNLPYRKKLKKLCHDIGEFYNSIKMNRRNPIIFWDIIHPKIRTLCQRKFENGYFADSVETAMKEINSIVKQMYWELNKEEKDGKALMMASFSINNPHIIVGDINTQTGKNIQEGYMYLFSGGIQAFRNPTAHNNLSIQKNIALHQLTFASLLMYVLDDSSIRK